MRLIKRAFDICYAPISGKTKAEYFDLSRSRVNIRRAASYLNLTLCTRKLCHWKYSTFSNGMQARSESSLTTQCADIVDVDALYEAMNKIQH